MMYRELTVFLVLSLAGALAQAQKPDISFKTTKVTDGIFMLEGVGGFAGGNLGLLTGDDGVVLIDDALKPLAPIMLKAVREAAGASVDFVINTHAHGDHIGGNEVLNRIGATVVAHDNIRQRLIDEAVSSGQPMPDSASLPEITFSESTTFHLNGHEAYIFHVAHAHTDGDAVIHFRNANVIHTGDVMFNGLFPFIDLDSGGSLDGYIAAQQKILALADDKTRLIPGHGPLATRADLEAANTMLIDARARVKKLMDEGSSEADILAENPLADYHDDWNWGFISTEIMTKTLIRALGGHH